ncbi:unnamed protein product [Kuraishia capsulata CBS 1993]|uniref:Spindle pole body component n=1 Tax=Kuraishia capsulata CBS 1993 TaxID=1382522 RepID=W6MWK2_9ASCO|nr:uncharacterized protein KUCA_T00003533001 [Kuraishia capsulata CBS 1993]CDK27555.1 unnamed protein product [Kuraishia capsulata CBS 1993]
MSQNAPPMMGAPHVFTELPLLNQDKPSGRCLQFTDLSVNDSGESYAKAFQIESLANLKEQEALLMIDLLYLMRGSEGSYVRYVSTFTHDDLNRRILGPQYKTGKVLYISHKEICKRILKNATVYYALSAFVEFYDSVEYGKTIQALCFQIKQCLQVYDDLLKKIEFECASNRKYNLQAMEHDFKVSISSEIDAMYRITTQIHEGNIHRSSIAVRRGMQYDNMRNTLSDIPLFAISDTSCNKYVNGGVVLGMIYELIELNKSDTRIRSFLTNVYEEVSKPMVQMLNQWLNLGQVDDPEDEFIITQNEELPWSSASEFYWKNRFTFKTESLPVQFADSNLQHQVIDTGLYLNVLRAWGVDPSDLVGRVNVESLLEDSISFKIEDAFKRASSMMLILLFDENSASLKVILKQLVKHLLVVDSDFLNQVFSKTMPQLMKSRSKFSITSFQNNFNMVSSKETIGGFKLNEFIFPVLREQTFASSLRNILNSKANDWKKIFEDGDLSKVNYMVQSMSSKELVNPTLNDKSRSIEFLDLEVEIPFPMNIFVSKVHVSECQLLFRHYSYLHFVEQSQLIAFGEISKHANWKWRFRNPSIRQWISDVRQLHCRMRQVVSVFGQHFSNYVVLYHWQALEARLKEETNVDDLQNSIKTFFGQVMQYSFLTNMTLFDEYTQLMETILEYDKFLLSLRKTLVTLDSDLFEQNREAMKQGQEFDPQKASKRFEKAKTYLALIEAAFQHNLTQFNKRLEYYGNKGTQSFLVLNEVLSDVYHREDDFY